MWVRHYVEHKTDVNTLAVCVSQGVFCIHACWACSRLTLTLRFVPVSSLSEPTLPLCRLLRFPSFIPVLSCVCLPDRCVGS